MSHYQSFQNEKTNHQIFLWYFITFILIWLMVMLGGATRLVHAGLSIVEWKPITGIIPPLNLQDWMAEFQKYQMTPEFIQINNGMTITEFKFIYWMEYFHRLLGRLIGLFFIIPLIILWRKLPFEFKKKSLFILCLGGLQGAMGWYMVKSGLSKDPSVCHYRLTVHLFLAFILMGLLVKSIVKLKKLDVIYTKKTTLLYMAVSYVIFTIIYGGFVAGLKAGLIYNTFPLMDGTFIPDDFLYQEPLWTNFISNPATVQWMHRIFAIQSLLHVFLFFRRENNFYTRIWLFLIITQVLLGILTLIYQVPVDLGTIHQGLGALVFSWSIVVLTLHKKQKEL